MMAKKFIHSDEDWEEIQREMYQWEQMLRENAKSCDGRPERMDIPSSEW